MFDTPYVFESKIKFNGFLRGKAFRKHFRKHKNCKSKKKIFFCVIISIQSNFLFIQYFKKINKIEYSLIFSRWQNQKKKKTFYHSQPRQVSTYWSILFID